MASSWQVLLVDDEPDIHDISKLALKHKTWRKRGFELVSAHSGAEAAEIIKARGSEGFQVGIIDVVMETNDAGLKLCQLIRSLCPSSFRIVLRTGQPGVAPEEVVLNEYDIDYYLAKVEATPERLYSVIRACLRSSEDIATLLAYGSQLKNFTKALQSVSSLQDLLVFMKEGLRFLELKHSAATVFVCDLMTTTDPHAVVASAELEYDQEKLLKVLGEVHTKDELSQRIPGGEIGLPETSFVIPFKVPIGADKETDSIEWAKGGLYLEMKPDFITEKAVTDFCVDALLFVENWKIAYSTLRLQEKLARETMLNEKMYYERMQGIATMVTGVAHEMNTPLGVAMTANSMVTELAAKIVSDAPGDEAARKEMVGDLTSTCDLLTKNLKRAEGLIRSFKQLSSSQLVDQKVEVDLVETVRNCVVTMSPELTKRELTINIHEPDGLMMWNGYPSHLSQVIVNFIQNVIRYAYVNQSGVVDIRFSKVKMKKEEGYRLEFEDYGAGVSAEVAKDIFAPFVTTGRGKGGTGLGLAISHNIVTNLLKGKIACKSELGKGTTFVVDVPLVVSDIDE